MAWKNAFQSGKPLWRTRRRRRRRGEEIEARVFVRKSAPLGDEHDQSSPG